MFITLEGIEGSGKTTLARALAARLEERGRSCLITREPGGSRLGKELRSLLLRSDSVVNPTAELFLFLADRAQHVQDVVRPALAEGRIVLCDRFVDSTLVYQGSGRGFEADELRQLCLLATGGLWPELTFVLDLDVYYGLERAAQRHKLENTFAAEGRFEAESMAFHEKVRAGFLHLAATEPGRVVALNGSAGPEEVLEEAWNVLLERGLVA
jgi:thymidylate kinase